jgi:ABC-2 type transport system permease protein
VRALRRSGIWWGFAIVTFALVNLAFWPSLEGSDALDELEGMSEGLLEAFGAQDIATPAGYLDGQLFALMLPLLLSGLAIAAVTAITSGDEDAGRLELLHALPVTRRAVWLWRLASTLAVLGVVAIVTAVVVALSRGLFSLDEVGAVRIVSATVACALLAAFHAIVAYAVGGFGGSRAASVGVAVLVLVAGYVANFLLPLSDGLAGMRKASPWYWAIGEQPVSDGIDGRWLVLLVAVSAGLVALGTAALERRDIRSA